MPMLFTWLGRRDSNPRMPGPKPGALPLGDVPLARRKRFGAGILHKPRLQRSLLIRCRVVQRVTDTILLYFCVLFNSDASLWQLV